MTSEAWQQEFRPLSPRLTSLGPPRFSATLFPLLPPIDSSFGWRVYLLQNRDGAVRDIIRRVDHATADVEGTDPAPYLVSVRIHDRGETDAM